tara:strand:- start:3145 stop:4821 length:1677 start_codon:yes stop_codon:yes gene_type:complete
MTRNYSWNLDDVKVGENGHLGWSLGNTATFEHPFLRENLSPKQFEQNEKEDSASLVKDLRREYKNWYNPSIFYDPGNKTIFAGYSTEAKENKVHTSPIRHGLSENYQRVMNGLLIEWKMPVCTACQLSAPVLTYIMEMIAHDLREGQTDIPRLNQFFNLSDKEIDERFTSEHTRYWNPTEVYIIEVLHNDAHPVDAENSYSDMQKNVESWCVKNFNYPNRFVYVPHGYQYGVMDCKTYYGEFCSRHDHLIDTLFVNLMNHLMQKLPLWKNDLLRTGIDLFGHETENFTKVFPFDSPWDDYEDPYFYEYLKRLLCEDGKDSLLQRRYSSTSDQMDAVKWFCHTAWLQMISCSNLIHECESREEAYPLISKWLSNGFLLDDDEILRAVDGQVKEWVISGESTERWEESELYSEYVHTWFAWKHEGTNRHSINSGSGGEGISTTVIGMHDLWYEFFKWVRLIEEELETSKWSEEYPEAISAINEMTGIKTPSSNQTTYDAYLVSSTEKELAVENASIQDTSSGEEEEETCIEHRTKNSHTEKLKNLIDVLIKKGVIDESDI